MMASSSHLKEGEKGAIVARVSTQDKTGDISETIDVLTNDPAHPKVRLTVRATIIQNLMPADQDNICK